MIEEKGVQIDKIAQVVNDASARFKEEQEQLVLEWQRVVIANTEINEQ